MTNAVEAQTQVTDGMAKSVYILYLAGLLTGITALIGVIIAYVNCSDSPEWLRSTKSALSGWVACGSSSLACSP